MTITTKITDIEKLKANTPIEMADQLIQLEAIQRGIKAKIDQYKADLLKLTQETDVYQLKTGKYTISRAKRVTPKVVDFETLKESLTKAKVPFETKEVFEDYMRGVFSQAIKEGKHFEGLEASETEYVMVRLAKK